MLLKCFKGYLEICLVAAIDLLLSFEGLLLRSLHVGLWLLTSIVRITCVLLDRLSSNICLLVMLVNGKVFPLLKLLHV